VQELLLARLDRLARVEEELQAPQENPLRVELAAVAP